MPSEKLKSVEIVNILALAFKIEAERWTDSCLPNFFHGR